MQFGNLPAEQYEKADLSLPADPAFNNAIFQGKPAINPKVYIGGPKWGTKDWKGKVFPFKTADKEFFDFYAKQYNSIELNATHYLIYPEDHINKWKQKVGKKDFLFCPKVFKGITHSGSLRGKEYVTNEFLTSIRMLRPYLGPVLLQVSETFAPKRKEELFDYMKQLPVSEFQFFFEVRHPQWYSDKNMLEELFNTLGQLKIGAVITDAPARRDCAHMYLPVDKAYIRYIGNGIGKKDMERINYWMDKIEYWLSKGLKELYFFLHIDDEKYFPEFSIKFIEELNKRTGLGLEVPKMVNRDQCLF